MGAGVLQMLPAAAAAPSRPVDRDISSYVLFALNKVDIKGGDETGPSVIPGNVGVNNPDTFNGVSLEICTNRDVLFVDGTQLIADSARLPDHCNIDKVFVNTIEGTNGATVRSGRGNYTPPILVPNDGDGTNEVGELPAFPAFGPCADPNAPQVILNDANRPPGNPAPAPLTPGTYGRIKLDGGTLTLGSGTYTFCSINFSDETGKIITAPDTVVQVVQKMVVDGGDVGPHESAKFFIKNEGNGNDTTNFGQGSNVKGTFWAPFGDIDLGRDTKLAGHFWAFHLGSDFGFNTGTTTTTLPTTSTSTTSTTAPTTTTSTTTTSTTIPSTTTSTSSTTTSTSTTSTSTSTTSTSTSTTVPETTSTVVDQETTTTVPQTTSTVVGEATTTTFTGSTQATVTTTTIGTTPTTVTTSALPRTGSDSNRGAVAGFTFILAGAALLGIARRRPASA